MRTLVAIVEWLAARAGANIRADTGPPAWSDATTADRAGRLVPAPQDGLEPEVGRSLGEDWALWLAVGVILLIVGAGYMRRRWRARGHARPAWLTWRGPR